MGIFNAAFIEAEFWAWERLLGASGVAASENLWLDWIITMPWYAGMVWLFVRGQQRSRFTPATVLLLGGLYELGADGIVGGQVVPLIGGQPVNLVEAWVFLILIGFWEFILVYSSMLLPPTWIVALHPPPAEGPRRWWDALRPLLWLVPYTLYLILLLILIVT